MVCCFACPYSASSHPELNFTTRTETCLLSSWFYLAWVTHFTTFECPCLVVFFSFLNLRIHIKFRYIFQDICLANSAELWENPLWCVWAQFFFTQSLIHIRQLKSKRTSFYLQNSKDDGHSKYYFHAWKDIYSAFWDRLYLPQSVTTIFHLFINTRQYIFQPMLGINHC